MKTTTLWVYEGHQMAMQQALPLTHAVRPDGKLDREYGASLYLLTGLEYAWPRLQRCVTDSGIDHREMLFCENLSTGEQLIVKLSGNLFNGDASFKFTPADLIGFLDDAMWTLVLNALAIRRGTVTLTEREIMDG